MQSPTTKSTTVLASRTQSHSITHDAKSTDCDAQYRRLKTQPYLHLEIQQQQALYDRILTTA